MRIGYRKEVVLGEGPEFSKDAFTYHTYAIQATLADCYGRSLHDKSAIYHRDKHECAKEAIEVDVIVQSLKSINVCGAQTRERIQI
jgi:hypothetical protein